MLRNIIHGIIHVKNSIRESKEVQLMDILISIKLTLDRMYTIHPNNPECFYLRILLHNVRGPTSFKNLKSVDGIEYDTYREEC